MSVKDIIDFIKNHGSFIFKNWYIFAIWTVVCITIAYFVFKALRKKQRDEITTLKTELETLKTQKNSEITALSNELETARKQIKEQKDCYKALEKEAWLSARRVKVDSPSARGVSEAIQKKYNK